MKSLTPLLATLVALAPFPALSDASEVTAGGRLSEAEASAIHRAREIGLARDAHWLKLGHYVRGLFGIQSEVDGSEFFLSREGKFAPEAELEATLHGLFSPEQSGDEHVSCRFPARRLFLQRRLELDDSALPRFRCPKLEDWKERISPSSATLVFSSFYLNNPSSAFGHSFLRLNNGKTAGPRGERHELLDYGVNYAAEVTTGNPIAYAWMGLVGGFHGTFTGVPYYYKVREYNDFEARDLWGYELNLTPEELELLVDHVWELGRTYYDYFYFTENCSYHMFTTLEAAAPRLKLTERLPFYVIPSDTMRVLYQEPGLVKRIEYRPSVRAVFERRVTELRGQETSTLGLVVGGERERWEPRLLELEKTAQARVLDAALDYMELRHPEDLMNTASASSRLKRELLVRRAGLGIRSEDFVVPPPERELPHRGHGVRRLTIGGGYEGERGSGEGSRVGGFARLGMRFALMDLLDPGAGYPRNAQIEFANLNLRYQAAQRQLELEDLTLFRVTSISPLTRFRRNPSFRVETGYERLKDRNCGGRCGAGIFQAGPGLAFQPFGGDGVTLYGFADAQLAFASSFRASKLRLGAGPAAGLLFLVNDDLRGQLEAAYRYQLFSVVTEAVDLKAEATWGFASPFAAHGRFLVSRDGWETSGGLMVYW